jgi:hypothetical protein
MRVISFYEVSSAHLSSNSDQEHVPCHQRTPDRSPQIFDGFRARSFGFEQLLRSSLSICSNSSIDFL